MFRLFLLLLAVAARAQRPTMQCLISGEVCPSPSTDACRVYTCHLGVACQPASNKPAGTPCPPLTTTGALQPCRLAACNAVGECSASIDAPPGAPCTPPGSACASTCLGGLCRPCPTVTDAADAATRPAVTGARATPIVAIASTVVITNTSTALTTMTMTTTTGASANASSAGGSVSPEASSWLPIAIAVPIAAVLVVGGAVAAAAVVRRRSRHAPTPAAKPSNNDYGQLPVRPAALYQEGNVDDVRRAAAP